MLISLLCLPAGAATDGGFCGDGVKRSLNGGVLRISGSGKMADYDSSADGRPWRSGQSNIRDL